MGGAFHDWITYISEQYFAQPRLIGKMCLHAEMYTSSSTSQITFIRFHAMIIKGADY